MTKPDENDRFLTGRLIAGVDEAGRGPLVGGVYAAAVILDPERPVAGLADSKRLTARRRESLAAEIREQATAWAVASCDHTEIDRLNILQATMEAMRRAVAGCTPQPAAVVVDGNRCPPLEIPCRAIIKGDATVAAISAASILAKVARDEEMVQLDQHYPEYGFARHKGYPTAAHLAALAQFGPTPLHRRTFAPVARLLAGDQGETK
jgi:ribonuclease HII